jgi:Gpi18-like mannosyltransferase
MTQLNSRQILRPQVRFNNNNWVNGLIFIIAMWLLSRLVIVIMMQLVAPSSPPLPLRFYTNPIPFGYTPGSVPKMGWELFANWDGAWYRKIATLGYDYAKYVPLHSLHSIAFFPLFPLLMRGLMSLGIPVEIAGVLVNNAAFLGTLLLVYRWVEERYETNTARWATAVLAWCPYSLYGSVVYTEGLFLFVTTASMQAFEKGHYAWAALWGAMATATRVTGVALVPTYLLLAWRERRPFTAYVVGLLTGGGLLLFIIYCTVSFGDPFAFVHVQRGWRQTVGGFDLSSWLKIAVTGLTFGSEFIKVIMIFGGGYLLWRLRHKLSSVLVIYGFCSLGLILSTGSSMSVDRFAYAIVSLPIALGVLLAHYPRWGYLLMGYFAILLANFALRFARWLWVA